MAEAENRRFTTGDFDFVLPDALVAQHPPAVRGTSRLLDVARHGRTLVDRGFPDLVQLIPTGDLLVVNTTRVRKARLLGTRPTSELPAEVLLIHPGKDDGTWVAMGKPGSAMQPGKRIRLAPGHEIETLAVLDDGFRLVQFVGITAEEAMRQYGHVPLPPYIDRADEPEDESRYQTVYAKREGSVAAPTAGLHFTEAILADLQQKGVEVGQLELDVGPGTFKPVDVDDITAHPMHEEQFDIPEALAAQIAALRARGGRLWAVGTTTVRALESVARPDGTVPAGPGATSIFIHPGYSWRAVDALITNFHLPRSTLLMLVSSFAGYDTAMAAYAHAVQAEYRFYSYGDAMVIHRS